MFYLAWKHGRLDPYRLYNDLDERYQPVEASDLDRWAGPSYPPQHPERLRAVLLAFGLLAEEDTARLATMRMAPA